MPTYVCYTATNRLSQNQKAEITKAITAAHWEETAGPRYLIQVVLLPTAACADTAARRAEQNRPFKALLACLAAPAGEHPGAKGETP
jgi:hypothetical protein